MRYQFDTLSARPMRDQPIRRFSSFFAAVLTTISLLISTPTIAADPVSKKPADLAKGKTTAATVCAACHMPDGNSVIAQNPILAGQHAAYLEKQLYNFKLKAGAKEPERNNAIMLGFASILSDEDIRNIAAFYAAQKANNASAKRKDLIVLGAKIYRSGLPEKGLPACAGCHSPNAAGIPAQFPRLAGQHPEYTEATLNNFRLGQRKNSAQMMTIAGKMTEAEIAAVSEYLASVR
ncbi:MAG: c-type cytochrome [Burkholderiaceae bacterium]